MKRKSVGELTLLWRIRHRAPQSSRELRLGIGDDCALLRPAAGEERLIRARRITALHRRLRPYRRLQLRVRDRLPTSFHEHEGIVDAIIRGDADLTAQRLREHVVVQGQRFADLIASLADLQRETTRALAASEGAGKGVGAKASPLARSRRPAP